MNHSTAKTMTGAIEKPRMPIKIQALAALSAVVAAVVLPQLFHVMGAMSGLGTALGEVFLPMHLPIFLVGLLAGPYAGAAAGLLAPILSYALSGMPGRALLPLMMLELCIYGLSTGMLAKTKLPVVAQVLIAQLAGKAVRACAILIIALVFHANTVPLSIIWTSIQTGVFGLILQLTLLPLIVYRVKNGKTAL